MFSAISTAIKQFFMAFTVMGSTLEHSAKALEYLSITAEETAGAYCDEARATRSKAQATLNAEIAAAEKQSVKAIKAA